MQNITLTRIMVTAVALVCVFIMLKKKGYVSNVGMLAALSTVASSSLVEVDDENFQTEVIDSPQPVMVDFAASWCGPCKKFAPVVAKLASKYEGQVKIVHIDIGNAPKTAKAYNVESIPTLMFFFKGTPVHTSVGLQSEKEVEASIQQLIELEQKYKDTKDRLV